MAISVTEILDDLIDDIQEWANRTGLTGATTLQDLFSNYDDRDELIGYLEEEYDVDLFDRLHERPETTLETVAALICSDLGGDSFNEDTDD